MLIVACPCAAVRTGQGAGCSDGGRADSRGGRGDIQHAGWKHNSHTHCLQNARKGKQKKKKKGKSKTYEERATQEEKHAAGVGQAASRNATAAPAILLVERTAEADAALQAAVASEDLESIVSTPNMELQVSR